MCVACLTRRLAMAVPVPKGDDFGRRRQSRRTLVLAVVFVLYLVLGGVVFGRLEVYQKESTVIRPSPAWRAVQGKAEGRPSGTAPLVVRLRDSMTAFRGKFHYLAQQ